jgi:Holliday junction resolvase RusA-like endonuclease
VQEGKLMRISFHVEGTAATKGSWKAMRAKSGRLLLRPDNEREKPWAEAVAWSARAAMAGAAPVAASVRVSIVVSVARPKTSKLAAPRMDVDKLARSILDAMTGIVYSDDVQVIALTISKRWGLQSRASICINTEEESP